MTFFACFVARRAIEMKPTDVSGSAFPPGNFHTEYFRNQTIFSLSDCQFIDGGRARNKKKFLFLFCLDHFDLAIVTRSNHRISRYRKIFQIYKCIYVSMYVKKSPMWPIYPKCPRLTKLCVITNGYELSRVIINFHELSWIVLNYHVLSWIVINHH